MAAPRILIVDDQRDITRMLRAALETLGRGYEVVDVPSAEEALLEIRRAPVDLLITDLRLPGITGLDLVKRLRNLANQAHMIVISAYADERTRAECSRLGATFFEKPLSLEAFLKGVQQALGDRGHAAAAEAPAEGQPAIADRLARLLRDLGAVGVFLVDLDGKVAVRAGDVADLDLEAVLPPLLMAFSASLKVSQVLGGREPLGQPSGGRVPGGHVPANVQFFDGNLYDIYTTNVGRVFALVIVFRGQRGSAQMGPVLRYGRQCADELLTSLRQIGAEAAQARTAAAQRPAPSVPAEPPAAARRKQTAPLGKSGRTGRTGPLPKKGKTAPLTPKAAEPAAEKPAPEEPAPDKPAAPLSPEELQRLEAAAKAVTAQAAASFWDSVTGEADLGDVRSGTLSWEQAEQLGLLPEKSPEEK